jgi:hypothetical protein
MVTERTSLQSLAANLDCETYRTLRGCEANVASYPEAAQELKNAVAALKQARTSLQRLMHEEDLHDALSAERFASNQGANER